MIEDYEDLYDDYLQTNDDANNYCGGPGYPAIAFDVYDRSNAIHNMIKELSIDDTDGDNLTIPVVEDYPPFQLIESNHLPSNLLTCGNNQSVMRRSAEDLVGERRGGGEERIVGGVEANPDNHPWHVEVRIGQQSCGGAVVGEYVIATAAHCCRNFEQTESDLVFNFQKFSITVPFTTVKTWSDTHYDAVNDIVYDTTGYDICLVNTLQSIYDVGARYGCGDGCVNAICLPSGKNYEIVEHTPYPGYTYYRAEGETERPQHGDVCWVAGFGKTSWGADTGSNTLQTVGVNIMDPNWCNANTHYNGDVVSWRELCAGIPAI